MRANILVKEANLVGGREIRCESTRPCLSEVRPGPQGLSQSASGNAPLPAVETPSTVQFTRKKLGPAPRPTESRKAPRILRHRQDRRSVAMVLAVLAAQGLALSWLGTQATALANCIAFLGLAWLSSVAMVINHNHIHTPFFRAPTLNRIFSILISVAAGLSSKFLTVAHNYNHHIVTNTEEDWCHEANAGRGPGIVRMIRYILVTWARMMTARSLKEGAPLLPRRFKEQEILEHVFIALFVVTCLVINPSAFVMIILPAWWVAAAFITLTNLIQHEGCDPESEFAHSRNLVGKLGNWLLFNAGLHTAHHNRPTAHWTELPALHQQINDKIPSGLNEPTLSGYVLRNYLLRMR